MEIFIIDVEYTSKGDLVLVSEVDAPLGKRIDKFVKVKDSWHLYPSMGSVSKLDGGAKLIEILEQDLKNAENLTFRDDKTFIKKVVDIMSTKKTIKYRKRIKSDRNKPVIAVVATQEEFQPDATIIGNTLANVESLEYSLMHTANKTGLSTLYNQYINKDYEDCYVVFVHDDVLIEDLYFVEKINEAHEQFDIVGVAGCKNPVIKHPPLWHLMCKPGEHRGFCAHVFPDGKNTMAAFGPSKESVDFLDGVLLSINVKKVLEAGVRFDEDFDFHFYDLAFCKRAKDAGLSLGVWPIFIRHYGLGHTDSSWESLAPKFIEKYGN